MLFPMNYYLIEPYETVFKILALSGIILNYCITYILAHNYFSLQAKKTLFLNVGFFEKIIYFKIMRNDIKICFIYQTICKMVKFHIKKYFD